jgi:hypothetical protein
MPFFDLLGGYLQGEATKDAAQTSAKAQLEAARIAAEESRFRPIGVTTRFGSSQFAMDPKTGRLKSAGYTVSPELKAYQDRLMALSSGALTDAEAARGQFQPLTGAASSLFNLGNQYLAQSPEQVAAQYMQGQQNLLAPSRERQYAQLQNNLFNTGRGGLAVGATGMRPDGSAGLGASNPELEAYYNAIAQQDAALAAQSQQEGQRQLAFGTGLFGQGAGMLGQYQQGQIGALSPFNSYFGGVSTLENLGQQPLDLGAQLGGRNANAMGAEALLTGGTNAALTMQQANSYNPLAAALQGAGSSPYVQQGVRSLFGGGGQQNTYNAPIEDRSYGAISGGAGSGSNYSWAY